MNAKQKAILQNILGEIESFDTQCERDQYTDTDQAWDVFNAAACGLRTVLNEEPADE